MAILWQPPAAALGPQSASRRRPRPWVHALPALLTLCPALARRNLPPASALPRDYPRPQAETGNPGTTTSTPYTLIHRAHPMFKNHPDDSTLWYRGIELTSENEGGNMGFWGKNRKVKKIFRGEVWDVLCCEGGPPGG